jgi:hypothetical protein
MVTLFEPADLRSRVTGYRKVQLARAIPSV